MQIYLLSIFSIIDDSLFESTKLGTYYLYLMIMFTIIFYGFTAFKDVNIYDMKSQDLLLLVIINIQIVQIHIKKRDNHFIHFPEILNSEQKNNYQKKELI